MEHTKDDPDKYCNDDSSVLADGLWSFITKFIIKMVVVSKRLGYLFPATCKLQLKEMDLIRGFAEIDLVETTFLSIRSNVLTKHKDWLDQAKEIAESINRHPTVPRTCRKQTLREANLSTDPKGFQRQVDSVQFLEHLASQLALRFSKDNLDAVEGFNIVLYLLSEIVRSVCSWKGDFSQFISNYLPEPQSERILKAKLAM